VVYLYVGDLIFGYGLLVDILQVEGCCGHLFDSSFKIQKN
ncbi:MAG: hypothetical protein RLZZ419_1960, partial [Pseudomonadota bacterium]